MARPVPPPEFVTLQDDITPEPLADKTGDNPGHGRLLMRLVINLQGRASLAVVGEMKPGLQQENAGVRGKGVRPWRARRVVAVARLCRGRRARPVAARREGLSKANDSARPKRRLVPVEFLLSKKSTGTISSAQIERCRAREDRGRLSSTLKQLAWPTDYCPVMRERRCLRPPR